MGWPGRLLLRSDQDEQLVLALYAIWHARGVSAQRPYTRGRAQEKMRHGGAPQVDHVPSDCSTAAGDNWMQGSRHSQLAAVARTETQASWRAQAISPAHSHPKAEPRTRNRCSAARPADRLGLCSAGRTSWRAVRSPYLGLSQGVGAAVDSESKWRQHLPRAERCSC